MSNLFRINVLILNHKPVVEKQFDPFESYLNELSLICNIIPFDDKSAIEQWASKNIPNVFIAPLLDGTGLTLSATLKKIFPKLFIIIFSHTACNSPAVRQRCFDSGANMVTMDAVSMRSVVTDVWNILKLPGKYICPRCGENLTEDALWLHDSRYHPNDKNISVNCPICKEKPRDNYTVHLHCEHGPIGRGEIKGEDHAPTKLYGFGLVICRNPVTKKYLVVQEYANCGFWVPGGRVDPGEQFQTAAIRETQEEAGVDISLKGVLRVEFTNSSYARMRVIFYAEPKDPNQLPKSIPDYESVGASWVTLEQLSHIKLRGSEPLEWITYLENGGVIFPMSVFTLEGAPTEIK